MRRAVGFADLGSTNGTFVNGRRIEEDTPVIPGESVHFGDVGFFVSRWEREDASSTVVKNPLKSALDAEVQCRRHAEQALWNCVVKTGAIVNAAAEGIITLDAVGHLETLNAAAERLFGYAAHELLGRHVSLLTSEPAALDGDAYMNRYFHCGADRMERETLGRRKDGETFPLRLSASEVELAEGRAFVIVLRDLTLEKQAEHALRRAKQAAEAANQAKGRFLANISHEIRTPMTAILGFAEQLLGEEGLDKAPRHRVEAFRTIKRNGEHLLELINEILDLSKIEAGKFEIQRVECSPWQIVEDVRQLLQIRADAKRLSLQTQCEGLAPARIVTDPKRLRQILVNFVDNAIKFTDRGYVRLTMRLAEPDEPTEVHFEVADTGIGMKSEHLGLLFEPFSQVDTSTTRRFGGTGLGMSISQRLAELSAAASRWKATLAEAACFV